MNSDLNCQYRLHFLNCSRLSHNHLMNLSHLSLHCNQNLLMFGCCFSYLNLMVLILSHSSSLNAMLNWLLSYCCCYCRQISSSRQISKACELMVHYPRPRPPHLSRGVCHKTDERFSFCALVVIELSRINNDINFANLSNK